MIYGELSSPLSTFFYGALSMSEEDVKLESITPAINRAGWNANAKKGFIKMEFAINAGRIIVRGNTTARGARKYADYLLFHQKDLPLAIVEAKDKKYSLGTGMQQAIEYAQMLDVPFAYSSNGTGFLEHDMTTGVERELSLDEFPSPEALWNRYIAAKKVTPAIERIITTPYFYEPNEPTTPRYYQRNAINRTVDAIARGQNRLLIVMATGTGKTFTAFQIIYRLWITGLKKRILFLVDRNYLVDQTMSGDFKAFSKVMTKVENRTLDSSYEIFLSLYHQLSGQEQDEDEGNEPYRAFSPNFFDLIIVDECHRGSAREDSRWRKILDYFSSATQIGMTATPKETHDVSNLSYFGEPIYTYSLKQGIEDGYLAPYKVIRIGINCDLEGWRPTSGQRDVDGYEIEDREYNSKDFDRNIIIDERTALVAKRITRFLKDTDDRFAKTIVFCVDIDHAERMRQALVNENSDLVTQNPKYVMRITGDNPEGKSQLDNFTAVDSTYPVIVTTSKLLTTGVDCKTCKVIVLDTNIGSMIEFKQIIGRGTRLRPDYGKEFFTILDFRNACRLFADPNFDGDPISVIDASPDPDAPVDASYTPKNKTTKPTDDEEGEKPRKYRVRGIDVSILNERVQFYDKDGKLTTESITDYSKKNILGQYATLNDFINAWDAEDKKQAIIDSLQERGVLLDALREAAGFRDIDDFDLICHIAYDKKPLTKAERANNVRKRGYLHQYSDTAREVIAALLDKYSDAGLATIDSIEVLSLDPFRNIGSPAHIVKLFGGREQYIQAVRNLQREIYKAA